MTSQIVWTASEAEIVAATVLTGGLIAFTVARWRRQMASEAVSPILSRAILISRCLLWLSLGALLAGPELHQRERRPVPSRVTLWVDETGSVREGEREMLLDWSDRLEARLRSAGATVNRVLGQDLEADLRRRVDSEHWIAVTDARGQVPEATSSGECAVLFPATVAPSVRLSVPVHPARAWSGVPTELTLQVAAEGLRGQPLRVSWLGEDGRALASESWTPGSDAARQYLTLEASFESAGRQPFEIRVDGPTGRLATTTGWLECSEEPIRVLHIEGLPTWTYRFLTAWAVRDPWLDWRAWLTSADDEAIQEASRNSPPLTSFPSYEELKLFDVVLLGDLDSSDLPAHAGEDLRRFVEEDGGALIFLSGPRRGAVAWFGSPLEQLVPFELDESAVWVEEAAYFPELTPEGQRTSWLRVDESVERSREILEGQGPEAMRPLGFTGHAGVGRPRAGARILARHPSSRAPLIASQELGAGRSVWLGVDELWRYRMGAEDRIFARLFGQLIRAEADLDRLVERSSGRWCPSRTQVTPGADVVLEWRGSLAAPETLTWRMPSGGHREVAVERGRALIGLEEEGLHRFGPDTGGCGVSVSKSFAELGALRAPEAWSSIGTPIRSADDLDRLDLPLPREERWIDGSTLELLAHDVVLMILIALLGMEWTLRKWARIE
ncbi:MAG: hypothetical protein RL885_03260 [Planctomycetota bacterium]